VAIVSTVVAFAIWLISRVVNVDTKITEELGQRSSKSRTSVYRGRFVSWFWLRLRASSARIQAEDSAMSRRSSASSSRRKKVALDHPIFTR
jgi:hypothetical protein